MNSKQNKAFDAVNRSFRFGNQWFFKTSERSLERAYQSALKIKLIEDEYFAGKKVSDDLGLYSKNIIDCLLGDVEKNLAIIQLRLAEFKISRTLLNNSSTTFWEKLRYIDDIVEKYRTPPNASALVLETTPQPVVKPPTPKPQVKSQISPLDFIEVQKVDGVSQKTGALPRSIGRTIQKIGIELDGNAEEKLLKNFRGVRNQTRSGLFFLFTLILIPILAQQLSMRFLFNPLVERARDTESARIFLNSEMKEEALIELQSFEEGLKFENLLYKIPQLSSEAIEEKVVEKANEIAEEFRHKSSQAISNIFADVVGLGVFALVIVSNRKGLNNFKSLLDSIVYDLSDSAKAFIIILFTDIFVGFHSPHGWEVLLEGLASHLGLPADRNLIFLFIATFPVILDTIFKYWIFRYLNQVSPSAVATLKNMNE